MNAKTRNGAARGLCMLVGAITVLAALSYGTPTASAQDIQITGPLAGAEACRNCRIYRQGRLQLQPFVGFTLQDEFSRTVLVGAQANYHFTDWLGLGLWGGFGLLHIDTGLTAQVEERGQVSDRNVVSLPSSDGFPDQIGTIDWMAALQLTFIPLRGKMALFQKAFIDADFYVFGGVAGVGVSERATVAKTDCVSGMGRDRPCLLGGQDERDSRVAIAPTFGVGLMLMANDWIGVSFEWRAIPFAWNTSGTDEGGADGEFPDGAIDSEDRIFHFNHMVNIGAAFYLPTAAGISE